MRNRPVIVMVVVALLMLFGCQQQTVYHRFQHISEPGWDKTDTITFDIAPLKTGGEYRLDAELRTDKDYPFRKLAIEINQTIYPSRETYHNEINCDLISEEGVIGGDGISYFQYRFHVRDMSLSQSDSIHLCITHNMKREIMPGIADVGILIRSLETGDRNQ